MEAIAVADMRCEELPDLVVVLRPKGSGKEAPERVRRPVGSDPRVMLGNLIELRHRILKPGGIQLVRCEVVEVLDRGRVFAQGEPPALGPPEHLMHGQPHGVAEHGLHRLGIRTELQMPLLRLPQGVVDLCHRPFTQRLTGSEMGEKLLLARLRTVQFQDEAAETRSGEA